MKRLQSIMFIAAWAGLAWLVFRASGKNDISDILWVNAAYIVSLIIFTVIIVVFATTFLNRRLRPPLIVIIGASVIIILSIAAIDVFWLRDIINRSLS